VFFAIVQHGVDEFLICTEPKYLSDGKRRTLSGPMGVIPNYFESAGVGLQDVYPALIGIAILQMATCIYRRIKAGDRSCER
jgi:hypothetical protein